MPQFNNGEPLPKLEKGDILMSGNPSEFSTILAENVFASSYTYFQLQSLVTASDLIVGKSYVCSNATAASFTLVLTACAVNKFENIAYDKDGNSFYYDFESDESSPLSFPLYVLNTQADFIFKFGLDGVIAFENNGIFYLCCGWNGGLNPKTVKEQYQSADFGVTWVQIADAPFTGRHTVATANANGKTYIVGGDYYNLEDDGAYAKDSYYFDNGSWNLISNNCGIENRILSQLVYHLGKFFLIGGQVSIVPSDGIFSNVLVSEDNCQTFTYLADTPFDGGNLWGAVTSFNGKLWKVCGGVYSDTNGERTYPRDIFSSIDGITWVNEGVFPGVGRQYAQLTVLGDSMVLTHGSNVNEGPNLNDIWVTKDGINWIEIENSDYTRHAHSSWVYNNNLYWACGTTNSDINILSDCVKFRNAKSLEDYISNSGQSKSSEAFGNNLALRDSRGYLQAVYLRSTNEDNINGAPLFIMGQNGDDGYLYRYTLAAILSFLELELIRVSSYEEGVSKIYYDNELGVVVTSGLQQQQRDINGALIPLPQKITDSLWGAADGSTLWQNPTGTRRTEFNQLGLIDLNVAPSSSSDIGEKGEIKITEDYIYVCTAINTWKRTSLSTW